MRVPVQLQVVAVLLAVEVVDFIPEFPAVQGQLLEIAVLFPCRARLKRLARFISYHIRVRKLMNLFMEMNCVRETFIHLSGLNMIA